VAGADGTEAPAKRRDVSITRLAFPV